MLLASILVACAMCAQPEGPVNPTPPVIAVHDVDTARAVENCAVVGAIVETLSCAILPPPVGLDPAAGPIVSIYTDDLDAGEAGRVAINAAFQGHATTSIRPAVDAPPPPYALSPAADAAASAPTN